MEYNYEPNKGQDTNESPNTGLQNSEEANWQYANCNDDAYRRTEAHRYRTTADKKANKLCIISLICFLFSKVISAISEAFSFDGTEQLMVALEAFQDLILIVGIVLVIYVRVKYPQNVLGKVLMWCYIVIVAFFLLALIIFAVYVYLVCFPGAESCNGMLLLLSEELLSNGGLFSSR